MDTAIEQQPSGSMPEPDAATEPKPIASNGHAGADIAEFDSAAACASGATMEVINPRSGEVFRHSDGRPFTILLLGRDSPAFRKKAMDQQDKRLAARMRTSAMILSAVQEKEDIELLVSATVSWDVFIGGRAPPSNSREYRDAYTKYPWLREQVDQFVGARSNFFKDSSTT